MSLVARLSLHIRTVVVRNPAEWRLSWRMERRRLNVYGRQVLMNCVLRKDGPEPRRMKPRTSCAKRAVDGCAASTLKGLAGLHDRPPIARCRPHALPRRVEQAHPAGPPPVQLGLASLGLAPGSASIHPGRCRPRGPGAAQRPPLRHPPVSAPDERQGRALRQDAARGVGLRPAPSHQRGPLQTLLAWVVTYNHRRPRTVPDGSSPMRVLFTKARGNHA